MTGPQMVICTKCGDKPAPASTGVCIGCALQQGILGAIDPRDPLYKEKKQ